jgi:hypothetical protein
MTEQQIIARMVELFRDPALDDDDSAESAEFDCLESQLVWQVDTEDPQAWVDAIILADSCRTMKQPAIEVWKQTMNVDRFRDQWKSLLSLPFARSTE